jgi:primosomal replication protein N
VCVCLCTELSGFAMCVCVLVYRAFWVRYVCVCACVQSFLGSLCVCVCLCTEPSGFAMCVCVLAYRAFWVRYVCVCACLQSFLGSLCVCVCLCTEPSGFAMCVCVLAYRAFWVRYVCVCVQSSLGCECRVCVLVNIVSSRLFVLPQVGPFCNSRGSRGRWPARGATQHFRTLQKTPPAKPSMRIMHRRRKVVLPPTRCV